MNLNQKETGLLKDLKEQEQLCIDKYSNYADRAADEQLTILFNRIADVERQHLETLKSIESGKTTFLQGNSSPQPTFRETYTTENQNKKDDAFLCTDLLTGEKHVSHLYDTCIFEFRDESLRSALNHIQKDEQGHGKMIYDYMKANNMYS